MLQGSLMKVNFACALEIKLEEERRGTEYMLLEVECKVSTVNDGSGCQVSCWCWSTVFLVPKVNEAVYQEVLEHFMLPAANQLYEDADFPTGLNTCTQSQSLQYLV